MNEFSMSLPTNDFPANLLCILVTIEILEVLGHTARVFQPGGTSMWTLVLATKLNNSHSWAMTRQADDMTLFRSNKKHLSTKVSTICAQFV